MLKTKKTHKINLKNYSWLVVFVFLMGMFFTTFNGKNNTFYFFTSIVSVKNPAPYDGTSLPILTAPKWTALTTDEYHAAYDQIPAAKMIPIPKYDPAVLKTPTEQLGWKSESDLAIRNAKITYSVPYMGNYELDGQEYAGSHLAVDIKIPTGTPVYAIGNGVVVKASNQSTGFGNHIVIRHDNFPDLNDSSVKETFYSAYGHMSELLVTEGDVITKGQLIGKSGETGTATTPHLHFQIDNSKAPWHPYWPYTSQEAYAAGLDFTSAINAGLGKEKAMEVTVNPLIYVQKYENGSGSVSSTTTEATTSTTTTTETTTSTDSNVTTTNTDLPPVVTPEENVVTTIDAVKISAFKITHDGNFVKGFPELVTLSALDGNGNVVTTYKPESELSVQLISGQADYPSTLNKNDFVNGVAKFYVNSKSDEDVKIKVTDGNVSTESEPMTVSLFTDLQASSGSYDAVQFLRDNNVISGYPDGTFKPDKVVSRVEALKFILNGINSNLISTKSLPFKDTSAKEWYANYVITGFNKQIVQGYNDKTFKPGNTVNRAEFLKMLLTAMEVQLPVVTRDVYSDVAKDDWFAPYIQYAKDRNLILVSGGEFKPEEGMTRQEVAETMYRMIMVKISGATKYSSGIELNDNKVSAYFS